MNLIEFTQIISDPSSISKGQTRGLDQILEEYPFFQAAHFLRLYALKKQRSFRYNDALKKTAAYTTDRELLFNYITNFDFDLLTESKSAPQEPTETQDDSQSLIEPAAEDTQREKEVSTEEERASGEELSPEEESLGIGRPLDFKSDESYSFGEWLQLSQLKPIDRGAPPEKARKKPRPTPPTGSFFSTISPTSILTS